MCMIEFPLYLLAPLMSTLWSPDKKETRWVLPRRQKDGTEDDDAVVEMSCGYFQTKYDKVQADIKTIGCMDDLLSGNNTLFCFYEVIYAIMCVHVGMLSKSKGQVLRVATILHVLFNMGNPTNIPRKISENSVKAADKIVDLCLQHAAYLGGRGLIHDAIEEIKCVFLLIRNVY